MATKRPYNRSEPRPEAGQPPRPVGRPRKVFTDEQVAKIDELAEAQCKDKTIALALGIDPDTFRRRFAARTEQKRAYGKAEVMQAQYRLALENTVAAIWWGKQHLGQSDRQDVTSGGKAVSIGMTIIKPEGVD